MASAIFCCILIIRRSYWVYFLNKIVTSSRNEQTCQRVNGAAHLETNHFKARTYLLHLEKSPTLLGLFKNVAKSQLDSWYGAGRLKQMPIKVLHRLSMPFQAYLMLMA